MIYTYGISTNDFTNVNKQFIFDYFKDKEGAAYDSETTGFDPHTCDLLCFQLGDKDNQFVVEGSKVLEFKSLLERLCLMGHNIKFDLKFLYKHKIYPVKVRDTYLAEAVIKCGDKYSKKSLAAVAKARIGVDLDKSVRANIGREGLTKRVIEYSARDVEYLDEIYENQAIHIAYHSLKNVLRLEEEFSIALAYIEYCGFKLDADKWRERLNKNLVELEKAESALNQIVLDLGYRDYINPQLDLFSDTTDFTLNWSSSRQVIQLFKKLGINTYDEKEKKDSIEAKNIEKYSNDFPIVKAYLKYKEIEKEVSTYGESFIRQINPVSGRLHTSFTQIMDTGRLSSGGSDKSTGEKYINFQNIPSDKETRSCFISEPGNVLVIADYAGQEQIVLANKSNDPGLLQFYDEGLGDMHSFVASKMYPDIANLSLDEIKEKHKDKRQTAKTAGFAINYGGVGATIARNNNLTLEEGNFVYESYFKAFPGLKAYFDRVRKEAVASGMIIMNDVIGRKCFIPTYGEFLDLCKEVDTRGFWEKWKALKIDHSSIEDEADYKHKKNQISLYFKMKGEMERMSLNYPIQGTSADITKISAIYFFRWLRSNNLIGIVKMVNQIHDENVVECPKDLTEKVKEALEDCMKRSADLFCKRVPLKADATISKFWTK